ncbi:MAG: hypothetical protein RLZZ127_2579 [Planctomycetota bacterium]|jgi:hypothetical protein
MDEARLEAIEFLLVTLIAQQCFGGQDPLAAAEMTQERATREARRILTPEGAGAIEQLLRQLPGRVASLAAPIDE